ncbi:MAG TPA: type II secretion system protein [Aquificaceae bacterium]|nr:type II secretion system protein [Aquificaceae bacterium]HIQ49221.1 type II secretion system protein [Aquifex aeolicus]
MGLVKGFTLLEVVIAFTILGITLSVLFSLLSQSTNTLEKLKRDWEDLITLEKKINLGSIEGVEVYEKKLEEYNLRVKVYRKRNVELITIE